MNEWGLKCILCSSFPTSEFGTFCYPKTGHVILPRDLWIARKSQTSSQSKDWNWFGAFSQSTGNTASLWIAWGREGQGIRASTLHSPTRSQQSKGCWSMSSERAVRVKRHFAKNFKYQQHFTHNTNSTPGTPPSQAQMNINCTTLLLKLALEISFQRLRNNSRFFFPEAKGFLISFELLA